MYLVYENKIHSFIYKEREQFVPMGMPIIFFYNVPSEIEQYDMDQELQHTYDFISCVAHFTFCFVLDQIS